MKKISVLALVIALAIGVVGYLSNIHQYYSMPEGETPNGVRMDAFSLRLGIKHRC